MIHTWLYQTCETVGFHFLYYSSLWGGSLLKWCVEVKFSVIVRVCFLSMWSFSLIVKVSPVGLMDTKFPWQQRPVAFLWIDPRDSLFHPVFFLLRLPSHIRVPITKAHQTMARPKQRSWNAVNTGRPLAPLHSASAQTGFSARRLTSTRGLLFNRAVNAPTGVSWRLFFCWLWHLSIEDIHYSVTACYSAAPVTVVSL